MVSVLYVAMLNHSRLASVEELRAYNCLTLIVGLFFFLLQIACIFACHLIKGSGRGGVVVSALDFRSEGRWLDAKSLPFST